MNRVDEFQRKYRDKFEQYRSVSQEETRIERKRERAREICNSSVASHRWWVEASSGAPKLARIKGGYKTSAEHQSSNQGTAATMRAFVVSSPSTISRFPDFSFSPLLPSTPFSFLLLLLSPATVFFHSDPLTLFSRVRQISWRNAKTLREMRRIRSPMRSRSKTGIEGSIRGRETGERGRK